MHREFPFDLVHAHYAAPAGDAVRRADPRLPLVVSVHGGDIYSVAARRLGKRAVEATLAHARVVIANSAGIAGRCAAHGARATRVVHLGAPIGAPENGKGDRATLISVGNLVARKRHEDVIAAVARLRDRHPDLRYVIVGDGPERSRLFDQAGALGVGGQAMGQGTPAIGCRGVDGPEEIAAAGAGLILVAPRDPGGLAEAIDVLLKDPEKRHELGRAARETVAGEFTWERCAQRTVEVYREALAAE
jgi:glycosyltransferase involved in cell wall biosynthesis